MSNFNMTSTSVQDTATTPAAAAAAAAASVVVVTVTSQQDNTATAQAPVVVTQYSTLQFTPSATPTSTSSSASASATAGASSLRQKSSGLSTGGIAGVAVGVAVLVLALLGLLIFFLFRIRKRRREDLAQKKEEQDQYAFHPNDSAAAAPLVNSQQGGNGAYRGWQPTMVTRQPSGPLNGAFQVGRGNNGAIAGAAAVPGLRRLNSGTTILETPTLPAVGLDDSLSETNVSHHMYDSVTSPGNGSPPLDAMEDAGSPSSEYSEGQRATTPGRSNYQRGQGMSSFMPALQPGHERQAAYGRSYVDF